MKYINLSGVDDLWNDIPQEFNHRDIVKWVEENVKECYRHYAIWNTGGPTYLRGVELDSEQAVIVIFKLKFGL